jgi:regulator of sigma E protease
MAKNVLIEEKRNARNNQMPIDFIDQLSKFEKSPIVSIDAVCYCGRFRRLGEYLFRIKDLVLSLMVKIKYFDEAKTILDNNKGKTISAVVLRDQKKLSIRLLTKKEN